MVQYCVAVGCSNSRGDSVSLFKFPADPVLREKWTREVRRTRDCWSGPTKHSVLCEKHFTEESFESDSAIASTMGIAKRKRLRPNAIPTIFERPRLTTETESRSTPSRKRVGGSATPGTSTSTSLMVKKPRTAYEKRERYRVRSNCRLFSKLSS